MTPGETTFSIVVPTHRRPRHLGVCLAALARLAYPRERFEVIVVIDGPDPIAERVAAGAEPPGPQIVVREHRGAPAARNSGAERAGGAFIAFTDDDCAPEPGWLEALERQLERHRDAAVGGRTLNGAPANIYSTASQAVVDAAHAHWNRDPAGPRFFASNNFAVPAEGFRSMGGFDARYSPVGGEDRDFCDRWLASGRRMDSAPDAVVHHNRELTLRAFLRQHFDYGRGARRLRRARAGRDGQPNLPEPGFYAQLAREGRAHTSGLRRLPLATLITVSQAANVAGYLVERNGAG